MSGYSSSKDGCAMIVREYKLTAGALICIHATVADIFLFVATRMRLMGKKKKFKDKEMAISKCPGIG